MSCPPCRTHGFTLIEISIVLVIIALITGGVLVGRELIVLGQARKIITQMEQFQLAVNAFKLKYNCLPGDCAHATRVNLGSNGNGNGINGGLAGESTTGATTACLRGPSGGLCASNIPGTPVWDNPRSFGEGQWFWAHLSAAGLIKEPIISNTQTAGVDTIIDTLYPRDALGREYLHAAMWNGKLYLRTGLASVTSTHGTTVWGRGILDAGLMQAIHGKFNDTIIIGLDAALSNHPTALVQGQRVVPTGTWSTAFYQDPTGSTGAFPACVVAAGNGAYRFNENRGRCDLLWQLDY